MDKLAALFEQLPIPEIARLVRRSAVGSIVLGVIALVTGALVGHALAGLGICVGLGIGLVNIRLITRSVSAVSAAAPAKPTKVLATRALGRLGVSTLVLVGLTVASVSVGLGAAAGIALYYLLFVVSLVRSIFSAASTPGAST
jgi:hypothetical protein